MSASVTKIARTSGQRRAYYIPYEGLVEGRGYRVSIVFEFTAGHFPTGDDAFLAGDYTKRKPWFWGHSYEEACKFAEEMNQKDFDLSPKEAALIIASSMSIKEKP